MKTKLLSTAFALLAGASLSADDKTASAVEANTDFAFDLYKQLAEENAGENLFFSPYSVSSALAMTAEGARGETALEMGKVLRYPDSIKTTKADVPWDLTAIHSGMAALNEQLSGEEDPAVVAEIKEQIAALQDKMAELDKNMAVAQNKGDWKAWREVKGERDGLVKKFNELSSKVDQYELNIANALWGEQSYPFKEDYFDKISKLYKTGGVFDVDFKTSAEEVRQRINSWVEEKTKERIKDLIPAGAVDDLTKLVLVNAIYFKGEWSVPFKEKDTRDMEFNFTDGTKEKKATMFANSLEGASYAAFNADGTFYKTPTRIRFGSKEKTDPGPEGFAVVDLPYKGERISMTIIAPNDPTNVDLIESNLTSDKVTGWIESLKKRKVHVYLPKFKGETSYTLGDSREPAALQKMGMVRAFTDPRAPEGAVFDGMSHAKSPIDKLYITKVLHKAFVEVNEKGTEAAAATAVIMATPASAPADMPFTPTFKADRPFVYLIRDNVSGSILFIGRMMNPEV